MSRLPEEVAGALPEVGWPQIPGFRSILVHQHFGVDIDIESLELEFKVSES